jgi:bifunctional ADP-heptose synthase (sugar kinase/adenylyltransferase)
LHFGHVQYLRNAATLGDRHIVILNGTSFLDRKKGYHCFSNEERSCILSAFSFVSGVYILDSELDTVDEALDMIRPNIFAKGGDRGPGNVPEEEICKKLGIKIVYGVGGNDKFNSSSDIIARAFRQKYGKEL